MDQEKKRKCDTSLHVQNTELRLNVEGNDSVGETTLMFIHVMNLWHLNKELMKGNI